MSLELIRRMLRKVENKDKIEFVVSADNPSISIHGDNITIKSILNGEKIITFIPIARGGTTRIQASEGTKVVLMADSITNFSTIQAKTFVTKKNKSIKEISNEVGFGTVRSFDRAFKSKKGETAREYRQRNA